MPQCLQPRIEIKQFLATFEQTGYQRDYKSVPFFGTVMGFDAKIPPGFVPIARDFICQPFNTFCSNDNNTIASIGKQGNTWRCS
jgi:hypothetical protein